MYVCIYIRITFIFYFTGTEGVTTVAVKTIKENATEVEKKDLLSELEVGFYCSLLIDFLN